MHTVDAIDGFHFAGVSCGIKNNQTPDLGLVYMPNGASIAGVYTNNLVVAAPVVLSRSAQHGGRINALLVNSGNANACTGATGDANALEMVKQVSEALDVPLEKVQLCSTGVIGQNLPMDAIRNGISAAISHLDADGGAAFAEAIRTTDLYRKVVRSTVTIGGRDYCIQGIAKGAGMIAPNMATMLAYVFTDAPIDPTNLSALWTRVCDQTFNAMTVDGDTSTNDTALMLASGSEQTTLTPSELAILEAEVLSVCDELAHLIVGDGEGATKAVRIHVSGARSQEDARRVADVVGGSPLVKTALHGEDPNWGRIIAAVGRSGVHIDPARVRLCFESIPLYDNGEWCGLEAERAVITVMKKARYEIHIELNVGTQSASVLTCDLTAEYVRINADYRS